MDDSDYIALETLNNFGTDIYDDNILFVVFGVLAVSLLVIISMRFSLNAVSFTDEEARTLGVNAGRMRIIVLVCATLMTTAAQVNYGDVGMLALLIPHLCRNWFGCDFRYILLGSAGIGAVIMMLCRFIRYLFRFNEYLVLIPVSIIINIVTIPVIIIILITQQRGWRQE